MFGILIAFKNFNYADGIIGSPWAGLDNFKFLIMSGDAATIIRNTLFYAIFFLIFNKIVEIFLAIMYDSLSKSKLNRFNQTVSILPHFLSWVVVAYFAAALLDECGLKGYTVGGAQVSEKHAGFIINTGDATAADILALIKHVQDTVRAKDGVELECEVRIVGEDAP